MEKEMKSVSGGEEKVEVTQVNEREIWVGESRIYLGDDNIMYVTEVGEMDEKIAIETAKVILKLEDIAVGKVNGLVDLNRAGKSSPEARKIWKKMTEEGNTDKIAMIGMNPVARVLASFIAGVSRKKNLRFFKTKEEALAWFKQENQKE